ncbi:2304_t:CDS:1, partial [Racocetra persica]
MHELTSDIIFEMLQVAKTRCSFGWRNGKCCCMIRSSYGKMTFVILEEPIIDKNIVNKS